MAQDMPENIRILRLFGAPAETVDGLIDSARDKDILEAQAMHQGGESLLLLTAHGRDAAENAAALSRWERRVRAACGDALYGQGDTSLTQAAVQAMLAKDKILVCANEETAALLDQRLAACNGAKEIYDFGSQSFLKSGPAKKIAAAGKRQSDPVLAAAEMARAAARCAGADLGLAVVPSSSGSFLLMALEKEYAVRLVSPAEKPALWLMDMVRRAALGCAQCPGTQLLRYGRPLPDTLQMPAQQAARGLADESLTIRGHVFKPEAPEDDLPAGQPPTPPKNEHPLRSLLLALALICLLAVAAAAVFQIYTGDVLDPGGAGGGAQSSMNGAELV